MVWRGVSGQMAHRLRNHSDRARYWPPPGWPKRLWAPHRLGRIYLVESVCSTRTSDLKNDPVGTCRNMTLSREEHG